MRTRTGTGLLKACNPYRIVPWLGCLRCALDATRSIRKVLISIYTEVNTAQLGLDNSLTHSLTAILPTTDTHPPRIVHNPGTLPSPEFFFLRTRHHRHIRTVLLRMDQHLFSKHRHLRNKHQHQHQLSNSCGQATAMTILATNASSEDCDWESTLSQEIWRKSSAVIEIILCRMRQVGHGMVSRRYLDMAVYIGDETVLSSF